MLSILVTLTVRADSLRVSWLGNTFGGGGKWVQNNVSALYVGADGTCYTNSYWDEAGHEAGIYRRGDVVGACADTHGHGGWAVAADEQFVFLAYAKSDGRCGVRRYEAKTGKPSPAAGHEKDEGFLELTKSPGAIRGLAVVEGKLLACDYDANVVHVITIGDMTEQRSFPLDRPQRLAVGRDGSLWVVSGTPAKVVRLRRDGVRLGEVIDDVVDPVALAVDPKGWLLVADDGPDQQVKVYDVASGKPRCVATVGEKGGIYAGRRGLTGPLRFNGLTGVGCDAAGKVYVSHNGLGPHFRDHPGFGAELKCFGGDGAMKWQLLGLEFVDTAAVDPTSDADVFTKDEHHVLDYAKTTPGAEWSYRGFTIDRFRYPDDPRLHLSAECVLGVRRLGGRRLLYLSDMYAKFVIVYRLEAGSEIAVPCAMFGREHLKENWPPNQPKEGAWLWRDLDGDGRFGSLEFEGNGTDNAFVWGWSVDANGTVWKALREEGLRRFPLRGFDVLGGPIYRYADSSVEPNPEPFVWSPGFKGDVNRIEYDAGHDAMYLAGYTPEHPNRPEMWGLVGTVICRYDGWSLGVRKPTWQIELPYDAAEAAKEKVLPKSMALAGDYLFVAYQQQAKVLAYEARTGKLAATLTPGGQNVGWIDVPYGISAARRGEGEYLIFSEEDWGGRVLLYRWRE